MQRFRSCQQDRLYLNGGRYSYSGRWSTKIASNIANETGHGSSAECRDYFSDAGDYNNRPNSEYHGDLIMGVLIIVLPFLTLSIFLPYVLPVKCPRCRGKMRFHFRPAIKTENGEAPRFAYICEWCRYDYEWEGASSSSSLD